MRWAWSVVRVAFVIGYGWAGGVVELWPAVDVGERGGENVGVGCVGRAEGYDATAVWVVDVAEIGQSETVHEIAGREMSVVGGAGSETHPGSLTRDMRASINTQRDAGRHQTAMLVPIACRFGTYSLPAISPAQLTRAVPYDQWFLTHIDDDSKIRQVKLWILSKCNLVQSPGPQTQRPASPITFASSIHSRSSLDSLDDGYNEDDEYSDQDLPPRHPRLHPALDPKPGPSSQSVQPGSSPLVDQYTLISFSTGSMLEDEFTLSWYNFRPYELLEMHSLGIVAPLQRDVLVEYIQPYFLAKVRVLRAVWNHRSGRFEAPGIDPQREHGGYKGKDKLAHRLDTISPKSSPLQSEKRRKTKLDWKTRWVVINHGVLSLCKEHIMVHRSLSARQHHTDRPISDESSTSPICIEHDKSTSWRRGA